MKTLDEIAEACAGSLVTVGHRPRMGANPWFVRVGACDVPGYHSCEESAEATADGYRAEVASAVLAALHESASPPSDMPYISDGNVCGALHVLADHLASNGNTGAEKMALAVLGGVQKLTRLCAFLMRSEEGVAYAQGHDEGFAAGRRAGFAEGAQAQLGACVAAADAAWQGVGGSAKVGARHVLSAVEQTPTVGGE